MNTREITSTRNVLRVVAVDFALLTVACLIPILSHLAAIPLYKFNPMLIVIMAGMLIVNDSRNMYLLAVLIPLVTSLVTGMPSLAGAVCIMIEYAVVITMFVLFKDKSSWVKAFVAILVSMMVARVVYYIAKWLILSPEKIINTPLLLQSIVTVVTAILFALLWQRIHGTSK